MTGIERIAPLHGSSAQLATELGRAGSRVGNGKRSSKRSLNWVLVHTLLLCTLALAQVYEAAAGECKQNVNALETDCHMVADKTYK